MRQNHLQFTQVLEMKPLAQSFRHGSGEPASVSQ